MSGWMIALRLTGLGWYLGISIVFGLLGGVQLDRWMGSSPLFLILGIGFGVVVGFYGIYKMVLPLFDEITND